ncbi:hypothetical protein DIPPA_29277 [Diplonema papillatum]|nr:hypothetical protein DIPPA_29277 [Diplonema papillatum]
MTVCALVGAVAALGYSEWVKAGVDDVVFPMERFTRGDGLEYVGTNTVDCSVKDPSGNKVNVPAPVGYMEFGFTVPEDALYTVKVNLLATDSLADSFWGQLDGGAKMKWFVARGNDFLWDTFSPFSFADGDQKQMCHALPIGYHTLRLFVREPGAAVESINVTYADPPTISAASEGCGSTGCPREGGSMARFLVHGLCGPDTLPEVTVAGKPCTDLIIESASTFRCTVPPVDAAVAVVVLTQAGFSVQKSLQYAAEDAGGTTTIVIIAVVVGVLFVGGGIAVWLSTAKMRSYRKMYNTASIAENLAEKVASLELDELEYLDHIENPSSTQVAFQKVVAHLKYYRTFLPQSLLATYTDDSDTSQDDTNTSGTATPANKKSMRKQTHSFRSGSRSIASRMTTMRQLSPADRMNSERPLSKKATVLQFNLRNFTRASKNPANGILMQKDALDTVTRMVAAEKGIVDTFQGDHFTCLFNVARPVATHVVSAGRCAAALGAELKATNSLNLTIGIATGPCVVATMGTDSMKRLNVVGAPYLQAIVLERLCKQYEAAGVHNLVTAGCIQDMDQNLVVTYVDVVILPGRERASVLGTVVSAKKTEEENEWMYELEANEVQDPVRDMLDLYLMGATAEARKLAEREETAHVRHIVMANGSPEQYATESQGLFYSTCFSGSSGCSGSAPLAAGGSRLAPPSKAVPASAKSPKRTDDNDAATRLLSLVHDADSVESVEMAA